ncbi:MAG TPA: hypothetical protein V6D26_26255 [Stenomitos sp.]
MTLDLTAKWYNAVVRDCHLDPKTFQLVQGNMVLDYTSEFLWNILDAVPPESVTHLYNPAQVNNFSDNYGAIISSLEPSTTLVQEAVATWNAAGGSTAVKTYNNTINNLLQELNRAQGFEVTMNTTSESTDLSQTWTKGTVEIPLHPFRLAKGKNRAPGETLELANAIIKVQFQHLLTFVAGPLSKQSTLDSDLKDYKPWYRPAALQLAYSERKAWSNPESWKTYFGQQGSMLRRCTSLVVVDGVRTVTTPGRELGASRHQEVNTAGSRAVFWPFPVNDLIVQETDGDQLIMNSPTGNPFILGVNVLTLPEYLGASRDRTSGFIGVKNTGGFVARFSVHYEQDGTQKTIKSDNFTAGTQKVIPIPPDAKNIYVKIEEQYWINKWSTVCAFGLVKPDKKCYEVYGTTLNAHCKEIQCWS